MKTPKDFELWNQEKQKIHFDEKANTVFVNEREVWYTYLWTNIWFEQDSKRPVLVVKRIWSLFFVIPLTTKLKPENPFYYKLKTMYFGKPSSFILSQAKSIDKKRLDRYLWKISKEEFEQIKKLLRDIYSQKLYNFNHLSNNWEDRSRRTFVKTNIVKKNKKSSKKTQKKDFLYNIEENILVVSNKKKWNKKIICWKYLIC